MDGSFPKKVLIVEDNEDFLWLLRQNFANQLGIQVSYAMDGQEGLEMASTGYPDLMLIDINLPKMDGITMAKQVKANGIDTKMLFLTNVRDAEHISQAIDVVDEADYMVKSDVRMETIVQRAKIKLGLK